MCKLTPGTPGIELYKEQYFKEPNLKKDQTKQNLNFSLQNSCTPHVLNDIRIANVHNQPR